MIMTCLTMNDCVLATQALKMFRVKYNSSHHNSLTQKKSRQKRHSGIQEENKKRYLQELFHWCPHGVLCYLCTYMQPIKELKQVAKIKSTNFVKNINAKTKLGTYERNVKVSTEAACLLFSTRKWMQCTMLWLRK